MVLWSFQWMPYLVYLERKVLVLAILNLYNENLYFLPQVEADEFVNQQTCVDHNHV